MFCPQCGTTDTDDLKFCKSCGSNLFAVRKAVLSRDTDEKFDWRKTWVADMMLSHQERQKRRGETAEFKRYNEIKGGVITTCVGAGVMIFLRTLFQGIIASGHIEPDAVPILRVIWLAGIIPFLIGLGLAFNGLVVSRKQAEVANRALQGRLTPGPTTLGAPANVTDPSLQSNAWSEPPEFGVTENTTRELR
jgi:hypothetical protein